MDITFNCPECSQEMAVEDSAAGIEIQCPTCNKTISVPSAAPKLTVLPATAPGGASNAEALVSRHFIVPQRASPTPDDLIHKPAAPLDAAATKDGIHKLRLKTIKHSDCVEVGKDRFDEMVSQFLGKVGESNVVAMHPISYSHSGASGNSTVGDYGLMIIYRG